MDPIVTKTMAEIYLKQGHFQEAYEIFRILSERDPSDIEIEMRLKELSKQLKTSPPSVTEPLYPMSEKVNVLMRWLDNIKRRKRN